jgi:hypothetical protein
MRRTIAIVLAAMLASSMAFAQSNTNSGVGVTGKPGTKSGPATTKSGPGASNQAVLVLSAGVAEGAADQAPPRVAFFGFQLINTSLQSTTAEEKARIRMLDDAFRKKLCWRHDLGLLIIRCHVQRRIDDLRAHYPQGRVENRLGSSFA